MLIFKEHFGLDYKTVVNLVKIYGNDTEDLLKEYQGKELSADQISEKETLELIIKLKSIIHTTDIKSIKEDYQRVKENEDETQGFIKYKQTFSVENNLKRAYGRNIVQSLGSLNQQRDLETIEHTEDGQEYVVRKINGQFNRMVSLLGAYKKSESKEENMYQNWNTSQMAETHALCYSFCNESNIGTAKIRDGFFGGQLNQVEKKGIMISIKGFDHQAVVTVAPYDLQSKSQKIGTTTGRQMKFYMASNLPNQTRNLYSEVNIELQDLSEGVIEYKKIQPASIICFDEVDDESIRASIELSQGLGETIPIELMDRRELAVEQKQRIEELFTDFKNGETICPELIGQIITLFNNVRNAHGRSIYLEELIINEDALFNAMHLNTILLEAIRIIEGRIQNGDLEDGITALKAIKNFIKQEREKEVIKATTTKVQKTGINCEVDYAIDDILRRCVKKEARKENNEQSLGILENTQELSFNTFNIMHKKNTIDETTRNHRAHVNEEQLTLLDIKQSIDFQTIKREIEEVYKKGYYSESRKYDEEHIARVMVFANIIADLEETDEQTKQLLVEAVKYYSAGRQLDCAEPHGAYSAKIAGENLRGSHSLEDIGIIQCAIELQNFNELIPHNEKIYSGAWDKIKREKILELCKKYGVSESEIPRIDAIAKCLIDAVELDKTRFVYRGDDSSHEEIFSVANLQTTSAKRLIRNKLWTSR